MRRVIVAAWLSLLAASPVIAQNDADPPDGYAFGNPRLLTQQLVWGLVHGVRLLANACREAPEGAAVESAYADWLERNRDRIAGAAADLARHYFDRDAASFDRLTAALRLKTEIGLREDELAYACSSFVAAIEMPRYDLDLFYRLRRDAARVERAAAVRERAAACLKTLRPEQAAELAARFAAWTLANDRFEQVAQSRLLALKGGGAAERQWRRDAGAGAVPPAAACEDLGTALARPEFNLSNTFEDQDR